MGETPTRCYEGGKDSQEELETGFWIDFEGHKKWMGLGKMELRLAYHEEETEKTPGD